MSDTTYTGITNSKVTIEGGGSGAGKYSLLERVRDDNGREIGTVGTFFFDANGTEYAVVVLDKSNRLGSAKWASKASKVTDLEMHSPSSLFYKNRDTATSNTQKILDWCNANGYTSTACTHCRTLSYIVDGIKYYGQLPNIVELFSLLTNYEAIDAADTSTGYYSLFNMYTSNYWSSNQYHDSTAWAIVNGKMQEDTKTYSRGVVPVLEIPNR